LTLRESDGQGSGRSRPDPLVRLRTVSKTFGSSRVLKDFTIDIASGEVFGLLGHNGSGKSTLVKILAGYHDPDPGSIITVGEHSWDSERVHGPGLRQLRFIHQDLGLIPTVGAADNIGLVAGYRRSGVGSISWRRQRAYAESVLSAYGLDIDVDEPVARLSTGAQAVVGIARALHGWDETVPGLLVVDEATAALHPTEAEVLNRAVRATAQAGHAVMYISHRLDEVLQVCDRVGVLRDGALISVEHTSTQSIDALASAIAGRQLERRSYRPADGDGPVVLSVKGLTGTALRDFAVDVPAGGVVGVAGLQGSGRDELASLLFGATDRAAGSVTVAGRELRELTPKAAMRAGLAMVPAKRSLSVVGKLTARENLALTHIGDYWRGVALRTGAETQDAQELMSSLDVRPLDPEKPVGSFSGGNQQKVAIGKWIRRQPKVFVIDEPTQGVDVGAREGIYAAVASIAASGAGVVICSSDEQELSRICSRVLVLRDGRVAVDLQGDALTEQAIIKESHQ